MVYAMISDKAKAETNGEYIARGFIATAELLLPTDAPHHSKRKTAIEATFKHIYDIYRFESLTDEPTNHMTHSEHGKTHKGNQNTKTTAS